MAQLDRLNVLLLYSNAKMARLIRALLRSFGFRTVQEAFSVESAKKAIKNYRMDFIMLSANLEGAEYTEFMDWIRNSKECPHPTTPVIVTSSSASRQAVLRAVRSGADEFLGLPIVPRTLVNRVEAVIFKPRSYIRAPGYFGPDRRRMADPRYKGKERRQVAPQQEKDAEILD